MAIPGVSAVTSAISICGFDQLYTFHFLGFLPKSGSARAAAFQRIIFGESPCVIFESPKRIQQTLHDLHSKMSAVSGETVVFIARELTKLHEETFRGSLEDVRVNVTFNAHFTLHLQAIEWLTPERCRGEFTVVTSCTPLEHIDPGLLVSSLEQSGMRKAEAVKKVAQMTGVKRQDLVSQLITSTRPGKQL